MLETVTAIRFDRVMSSGRTSPCLMGCFRNDGIEVEVVVKLKAGCGNSTRPLLNEAVAAMLAAELGLPVPEPFVVNIEREFAEVIPDPKARSLAKQSIGPNFGSKKLPDGFVTIPRDLKWKKPLLKAAAEILAFDVFIENSDRRVDNPNLLWNGKTFAIYDHELAFAFDKLLFWKPPWEQGAIRQYPLTNHVLCTALRGKNPDFSRFLETLKSLRANRLREYGQALPSEWIGDSVALFRILGYIEELGTHASEAIDQLEGALR